jgi:hypothetical protein
MHCRLVSCFARFIHYDDGMRRLSSDPIFMHALVDHITSFTTANARGVCTQQQSSNERAYRADSPDYLAIKSRMHIDVRASGSDCSGLFTTSTDAHRLLPSAWSPSALSISDGGAGSPCSSLPSPHNSHSFEYTPPCKRRRYNPASENTIDSPVSSAWSGSPGPASPIIDEAATPDEQALAHELQLVVAFGNNTEHTVQLLNSAVVPSLLMYVGTVLTPRARTVRLLRRLMRQRALFVQLLQPPALVYVHITDNLLRRPYVSFKCQI